MIKLLNKVPDNVTVAVSGGVDSMVALSFLNNGRRKVSAAYFDHGTDYGNVAKEMVQSYCSKNNIPLQISKISNDMNPKMSREEFWRNHRYSFLSSISGKVITAHHLDDVVEWWVFSSLHGQSRLIPYMNGNVIRPFLLTPKSEIIKWAKKNNIPYIDDPSNLDTSYMRNFIRHSMMPNVLNVNPGMQKMLRKKIIHSFKNKDEVK